LELATAMHMRIAEPSTIYQLPEGRHGTFVGGGASVRSQAQEGLNAGFWGVVSQCRWHLLAIARNA
jgi:enoyl-CoA hydratase/carnithine racemase